MNPSLTPQPGALTPVALSPLPFPDYSNLTPARVISLPRSPTSSPISPEPTPTRFSPSNRRIDAPASSLLTPRASNGTPPTTPGVLQGVPPPPAPPQIILPPVRGTGLLPPVQFPTITLPTVTPQSIVNISTFGTLGTLVPTTLADNETGDLRWNRPDRPEPANANSSYRRIGCIGDGSCFFHAISKGLSEVYQASYREPTTVTEETLRRFEESVNGVVRFPSELFDQPRSNNPQTIYNIRRPPHFRENMSLAYRNLLEHFRLAYVRTLRQDFATKVMIDPRMDQIVKNRFSGSIELEFQILEANIAEYQIRHGLIRQEFKEPAQRQLLMDQAVQRVKERFAQELLSGNAVQPDFMLILSDYVGVDIYLLRDADLANPDPRNTPLYSGTSLHEVVHGPAELRPPGDPYRGAPDRRAIVIISIDDYHYEIVGRVDETQGPTGRSQYIYPNLSQNEPLIRQLYEMLRNLRAGAGQ